MVTLSPRKSTAVISHCFALRETVKRPLRVETRSVSLIINLRQGLKDVDGARFAHGIGEPRAIADHSTIDEDRHVLAEPRLIVEHVTARLRIFGKHSFKNVAHGAAGGFALRQRDVALNIRREDDLGHGLWSLGRANVGLNRLFPFAGACCDGPRLFWGWPLR